MKKLALLFVFVQSLVFANNPVITLNGDSLVEIYMGSNSVGPGATAYYEEDDNITNSIQVSEPVDNNTHGTYVLSSGNSAIQVTREVNVVENPTVEAGPGQAICEGDSFTITDSSASNYSSLYWTTSGDGLFSDSNILNPTYIPGPNDIIMESVTLTLHIHGDDGLTHIDNVVISITNLPSVSSGVDIIINQGESITLNTAIASNYSSLYWTTSGDGLFSDSNILNPTYIPGPNDIIMESVTLTLSATSQHPCAVVSVSDMRVIEISSNPTVDAGPDQAICEGDSFTITGSSASNYSSLYWEIVGGTGTFLNSHILAPTYVPSLTDIANGIVTLRLSASGTNNQVVSDEKKIFIEPCNTDIILNGTISAENHQIKNVADPTDAQDAATKAYVDALSIPQGRVPVLGSSVLSNISFNTVTVESSLSDTGGQIVLSKGFYVDTTSPPSAMTSQGIAPNNQETGSFTIGLSNLLPNTTYFVRSYATTIFGTGLGEIISFTTSSNLTIPELTTMPASEIFYTSAKVGANIISDGGSTIINRGICWSTSSNPTLSDSSIESGSGLGSFTLSLSSLNPDTIYYVRSYATNSFGTNYGSQVQFRTLSYNLPTLSTLSPNGLTTTSVNSGGNITNDGGAAITSRGVCWATTINPTILNNKTEDGSGSGLFNSFIQGLTTNNTYYIRAYATNSVGTSYGNQQTIVNNAVLPPNQTIPIVGTSSSNNILTATTASSGGYVSQNGGSDLIARGVCWSLAENPTIADSHTNDGTGLGFFTSTLTGLSGCGAVYYVRAYATNENGTGYGAQYTVSTGLLPTISTNSATSITENSFTSGGTIISDGGCPITAKGICWSTSPNPTTDNEVTNEGDGIDDFSSSATNLLSNLTYYVRAYVTNSVGTTYGEEIVINTGTPNGLYIGQSYAGGIIFYLDDTGQHGLVAAEEDLQNTEDWSGNQCPWGTFFETDTIIGSGAQNTANIISACNTTSNVAYICDNLVLNGYDDWFLPSKDELNLMFQNLKENELGNFASGSCIVSYASSSSESGSLQFFSQLFDSNCGRSIGAYYTFNIRNCNENIRAVRAF